MSDFLNLALSSVNLPLTILLLILVLYWVFTIISGIDFDLDFDIEVDVDVDADFDIDSDSNLEGGNVDFEDVSNAEVTKEQVVGKRPKSLKWWQVFLIYFNFVGLPFMFTFTAFTFAWWFICMLGTDITSSSDDTLGFIIFITSIIPALIFTKIFTSPFKNFFKKLNKDGDKAVDFLGRKGLSLSTVSGNKMGRAEIIADGNSMNIYFKSLHGEQIKYHDTILIIKASDDKNYFYAESYNE